MCWQKIHISDDAPSAVVSLVLGVWPRQQVCGLRTSRVMPELPTVSITRWFESVRTRSPSHRDFIDVKLWAMPTVQTLHDTLKLFHANLQSTAALKKHHNCTQTNVERIPDKRNEHCREPQHCTRSYPECQGPNRELCTLNRELSKHNIFQVRGLPREGPAKGG